MRLEFGRKWVLKHVLALMERREPDFMVGDPQEPQLKRWMLLRKNFFFNLYFHEFLKSDSDVPHDHPVANISWVLSCGYWEWRLQRFQTSVEAFGETCSKEQWLFFQSYGGIMTKHWVPEGGLKARWARTPHRVELDYAKQFATAGKKRRVITLFFCGPRLHPNWRFWCPRGHRVYSDYIASHSYGNRIGRGCD